MQKLTNEEILKIYLTYYPFYLEEYGSLQISLYSIETVIAEGRRMLLTPLSKISDEDAIEVAKMYYGTMKLSWFFFSLFQYLTSKGYAVPLFFGVGHWANGKTAIELELATDKTLNDGSKN